jgi:hypothetical protein
MTIPLTTGHSTVHFLAFPPILLCIKDRALAVKPAIDLLAILIEYCPDRFEPNVHWFGLLLR